MIYLRQFQEKFAQMITNAGFSNVTYENLTGGIVAIHTGFKIWLGSFKVDLSL